MAAAVEAQAGGVVTTAVGTNMARGMEVAVTAAITFIARPTITMVIVGMVTTTRVIEAVGVTMDIIRPPVIIIRPLICMDMGTRDTDMVMEVLAMRRVGRGGAHLRVLSLATTAVTWGTIRGPEPLWARLRDSFWDRLPTIGFSEGKMPPPARLRRSRTPIISGQSPR